MRKLLWGKTFIRAVKRASRRNPDLLEILPITLQLLSEDPFAPLLETHKLKGKLSGSWACKVGYDLRIIFDFVKSQEQGEDHILLLELGSHEEVY
jgi:addiction module RelE/StbE family toxin